MGDELVPTHICLGQGARYDDFWLNPSLDECYASRGFLKDIGDDKVTIGQTPPKASPAERISCPQPYSCMQKKEILPAECVVLASFTCASEDESCFKCQAQQQQQNVTPTAPAVSPPVELGCFFTGTGCCYNEDPNKCVALPPNSMTSCGAGLVPRVTGCVSGGCNAIFECVPEILPSPSPTTPTLYANATPTPSSSPAPQCVFTGTGCCTVENTNQCVAVPLDSCGTGSVPNVTGCASGGCKATFECVPSPTPIPTPTPIPDSCSDSDGGLDYFVQGTVTGYNYQQPLNSTDYCQEGGSGQPALLVDWYCSATSRNSSSPKNCADFNTNSSNYTCVSGACTAV